MLTRGMDSFEAEHRVKSILDLYRAAAARDYFGEAVTQVQHAVQSAMAAKQAGADDELIVAALLHDVGHLLDWENLRRHPDVGVIDHDRAGALYLSQLGFSRRVCGLVEGHVAAKRYLVATNEAYAARLSPASIMALELQGGPMTTTEAASFEASEFFHDCLRLRTWDEQSKDPNSVHRKIDNFDSLLLAHLISAND